MSNITKFQDFNLSTDINSEKDTMERELNNKKIEKEFLYDEYEINFDIIKNQVLTEIQNTNDFHLTMSKTKTETNGSKRDKLHVEYESSTIGKVIVYEPDLTKPMSYYIYNGREMIVNTSEIIEFYEKLKQHITDNRVIEKFDDFDTNFNFKNTITLVQCENNNRCLYLDGLKIYENDNINIFDFLKFLKNNNINILDYKLIDFPITIKDNDLRKIQFELPDELYKLYDTLNIEIQ